MTISPALSQYTWTLAKAAYERGEREFGVTPRYPMYPKQGGCSKCQNACDFVHFCHRDSGYLMLKCAYCGQELKGGLYEIGIRQDPVKRKRMFNDFQRWEILKRDGCRGFQCGTGPESDELEIDHIFPFSQGGPTAPENGVVLCRGCNQAKSGKFDTGYVLKALLHANMTPEDRESGDPDVAFRVLKKVAQFLKQWQGSVHPDGQTRKSI